MDFLRQFIQKYPDLADCLPDLTRAVQILATSFQAGGKLLVCGNGGSAADSEHIVGELMKGYRLKRPIPVELRARLKLEFPEHGEYLANHLQRALPAISLVSHISLITAFVNDVAADTVYAQQVLGYGQPGDVLMVLSTSGMSANVLHALRLARVIGLKTIGLTGQHSAQMKTLCDALICVPREITPDIQEGHQAIYHALCAILEERFFGV